ncbi:MAG: hypothetical protein HN610_10595 [Verrucomicrobia bacterium]|nr:hypothetical protein [Verrucomicrobiota bacterium]
MQAFPVALPERGQFSMSVLKTKRPWRSIALDESQNGNLDQVKSIAKTTAAFPKIE